MSQFKLECKSEWSPRSVELIGHGEERQLAVVVQQLEDDLGQPVAPLWLVSSAPGFASANLVGAAPAADEAVGDGLDRLPLFLPTNGALQDDAAGQDFLCQQRVDPFRAPRTESGFQVEPGEIAPLVLTKKEAPCLLFLCPLSVGVGECPKLRLPEGLAQPLESTKERHRLPGVDALVRRSYLPPKRLEDRLKLCQEVQGPEIRTDDDALQAGSDLDEISGGEVGDPVATYTLVFRTCVPVLQDTFDHDRMAQRGPLRALEPP